MIRQIYERLAIIHEDGRRAVLIIDDAHGLANADTLSELCGLVKLEYEERRLATVVLVGAPPLDAAIASRSARVVTTSTCACRSRRSPARRPSPISRRASRPRAARRPVAPGRERGAARARGRRARPDQRARRQRALRGVARGPPAGHALGRRARAPRSRLGSTRRARRAAARRRWRRSIPTRWRSVERAVPAADFDLEPDAILPSRAGAPAPRIGERTRRSRSRSARRRPRPRRRRSVHGAPRRLEAETGPETGVQVYFSPVAAGPRHASEENRSDPFSVKDPLIPRSVASAESPAAVCGSDGPDAACWRA